MVISEVDGNFLLFKVIQSKQNINIIKIYTFN